MKSWHSTFVVSFLALVPSLPVHAQVSFFQPPTYSGGGPVFVEDFNNDGKPDILAGDGTMNLGNGDGTFTLGKPLPGAPIGTIIAVADFNGDGKADVLEGNPDPLLGQGAGALVVLLGNGDGTFQPPISTPTGASLSPITVVDLRNNGLSDVIGIFNNNLLVYLCKGDGTFAVPVSYSLGTTITLPPPPILSVGDFNGDHKPDVVVSIASVPGSQSGREVTFLGNGDGALQPPVTSTGVNVPLSIAVADFTGDGILDLAVTDSNEVVEILAGQGDGTFKTLTTSVPPGFLAAADLRAKGKQDLVG